MKLTYIYVFLANVFLVGSAFTTKDPINSLLAAIVYALLAIATKRES